MTTVHQHCDWYTQFQVLLLCFHCFLPLCVCVCVGVGFSAVIFCAPLVIFWCLWKKKLLWFSIIMRLFHRRKQEAKSFTHNLNERWNKSIHKHSRVTAAAATTNCNRKTVKRYGQKFMTLMALGITRENQCPLKPWYIYFTFSFSSFTFISVVVVDVLFVVVIFFSCIDMRLSLKIFLPFGHLLLFTFCLKCQTKSFWHFLYLDKIYRAAQSFWNYFLPCNQMRQQSIFNLKFNIFDVLSHICINVCLFGLFFLVHILLFIEALKQRWFWTYHHFSFVLRILFPVFNDKNVYGA